MHITFSHLVMECFSNQSHQQSQLFILGIKTLCCIIIHILDKSSELLCQTQRYAKYLLKAIFSLELWSASGPASFWTTTCSLISPFLAKHLYSFIKYGHVTYMHIFAVQTFLTVCFMPSALDNDWKTLSTPVHWSAASNRFSNFGSLLRLLIRNWSGRLHCLRIILSISNDAIIQRIEQYARLINNSLLKIRIFQSLRHLDRIDSTCQHSNYDSFVPMLHWLDEQLRSFMCLIYFIIMFLYQ